MCERKEKNSCMRESKKENTESDEQNDETKKGMPNQRKRMFVTNDFDLLGLN